MRAKVLVVGGGGYFGRLLTQELLTHTGAHIILAGRNQRRLARVCKQLTPLHPGRVTIRTMDLSQPRSIRSALEKIRVAICAAGPFQRLPLTLLELCLQRGIHYIDLCDDRGFFEKAHDMASASAPPAAVCCGWSAIPALSGALVRIAAHDMDTVETIDIHLAPGNRSPRSASTVSSLLASVGKRFTVFQDGKWQSVEGWSCPQSFRFPPPMRSRCGYLVDVPDHALFPEVFGAQRVEFRVGSEIAAFNHALSVLAWLSRRKVVCDWSRWSRPLRQAMATFGFFGQDSGAVGVRVTGRQGSSRISRQASVLAKRAGQGIAVMPAAIMTATLLGPQGQLKGLVPVDSWISREHLEQECQQRGYNLVIEDAEVSR